MNKRIKELAEQCRTPPDFCMANYENFDEQKFAEIIIKECALLCISRPGPGDDIRSRLRCAEQIKEHFGVK